MTQILFSVMMQYSHKHCRVRCAVWTLLS